MDPVTYKYILYIGLGYGIGLHIYCTSYCRKIIKECVSATDEDVAIFTGNGVTGAVHKLIGALQLTVQKAKNTVSSLNIPNFLAIFDKRFNIINLV